MLRELGLPVVLATACVGLVWAPVEVYVVLIVIVAVASVILSRRMFGNLFSPPAVFAVGWLVPAAMVVFLPWHFRYEGWEVRTELWLVVLSAYFAFMLGHWVLLSIAVRSKGAVTPVGAIVRGADGQWEAYPGERSWNWLLIRCFFAFGMCGFAINMMHIFSAGGLALYVELGLRGTETIFGESTLINYLYFLNSLVVVLGTIQQLRFGYSRIISILMAISFLSLFFHGIKGTIIYPVVISLLAALYTKRSVRPRSVLIALLLVLMGFQFVTVGRSLPYLLARDEDWFTILTYRLENIFLYFTPSFANLQEEIVNFRHYRGGAESFGFLGDIVDFVVGRRGTAGGDATIPELLLINDAYNVGTFLRDHFRDFGYLGCIVFPFGYGVISTYCYIRYVREPSSRNIVVYAIISLILVFSFFSSQYFRIQYWYWIAVMLLADGVGRLCSQGEPRPAGTRAEGSTGC